MLESLEFEPGSTQEMPLVRCSFEPLEHHPEESGQLPRRISTEPSGKELRGHGCHRDK